MLIYKFLLHIREETAWINKFQEALLPTRMASTMRFVFLRLHIVELWRIFFSLQMWLTGGRFQINSQINNREK